jgi:hypothetical protein
MIMSKALSFKKETLRTLVSSELDAVHGGAGGEFPNPNPNDPNQQSRVDPLPGGQDPHSPEPSGARHPLPLY